MKIHPEPVEDVAAIEWLGGPKKARNILTHVVDALIEGILGDAKAAAPARELVDILIERASDDHANALKSLSGSTGAELLRIDGNLEGTRAQIRRLDALRKLIDARSGT